jgi:NAD(P)-dependent dehydrogenase (short-subunit alcohol dehydrogenase family)
MKLAGKIALITGAQQGIGAAIAVAMAEEGADVTLTWLDNEPAAAEVAARIRQAGRRVHLLRADVAQLTDIDMMVRDTADVLGTPDILVNNAGVCHRIRSHEQPCSSLRRMPMPLPGRFST